MPGGSKYEGPAENLELYVAAVGHHSNDIEVNGAKNPYTSRNGHMFSFLDKEGSVALRLSDELTSEFRTAYDSGPVIQYGATMRGYSSVPPDLLSNTAELSAWLARSWDWVGTLTPKATTK